MAGAPSASADFDDLFSQPILEMFDSWSAGSDLWLAGSSADFLDGLEAGAAFDSSIFAFDPTQPLGPWLAEMDHLLYTGFQNYVYLPLYAVSQDLMGYAEPLLNIVNQP
ncbi:MAG: hypothetical protein WBA50_09270, partial [Mycobacterium sp.]